jgi:site-specific DNA-cytosine methylase
MLDLFSGLGGASQAMKDRGWEVTTVDIDPKFLPDIVADVRYLTRLDVFSRGPFDLVWASPPCVDFSVIRRLPARRLNRSPDMSCIIATLRFMQAINPRFWILENAAGLEKELGPARQRFRWHYLWGEFPLILSDTKSDKGAKWRIGEHGRYGRGIPKWMVPALRAKIPYQLSLAVAEVCERRLALEESAQRNFEPEVTR